MKTHCTHGRRFVGEECVDCDREWATNVTLPQARELISRLMSFYDVETLRELVFEQHRHVRKLQDKMPPLPDLPPRKVREG